MKAETESRNVDNSQRRRRTVAIVEKSIIILLCVAIVVVVRIISFPLSLLLTPSLGTPERNSNGKELRLSKAMAKATVSVMSILASFHVAIRPSVNIGKRKYTKESGNRAFGLTILRLFTFVMLCYPAILEKLKTLLCTTASISTRAVKRV